MVYKCFDKKTFVSCIKMTNKEWAEELQKPIIRKFNKPKARSSLIDNIWGADLNYMQLICKFNKGICFYCVLLIYSVNTHGLFL